MLWRDKHRLVRSPILHMPNHEGRFYLYSDKSKFAMGSALCQIQNGKPKLIAYVGKRLPEAARNYSVTELELCSLAINIASFSHLLKRVDFDAIADHLALTHTIKSKVDLATVRIKRLLELISSYSFNLYYIKGKYMIINDFLSRKSMMIVIHMTSPLYLLICIIYYTKDITTYDQQTNI